MKKNIIKRIITLALTGTLLGATLTGCGAPAQQADNQASNQAASDQAGNQEVRVIRAATSGNPRPFTYQDENGEIKGQNIELIQAVFDRLPQYELEIEVTEFASIFTGIDSGYYQLGVNNIARNPEREAKYLYTDPEMVNSYIVVANKNVDIDSIPDLSVLEGYTYIGTPGNDKTTVIETYNAENPDHQINIQYDENGVQQELSDVESGRVDFLIIDAPMYYGYYEPEFHLDVNTFDLSNVKSSTYSYFIVGKEDTQLAEDINRALYEVIADGTAAEINERYLGADYAPSLDVLSFYEEQ